jgi:LPXTG-motif cell wall-anchored protein
MREQEATEQPKVSVEVEASAPIDLQQVAANGDTVAKGKATKQTKLTFRWTVATSANTGALTPEIELRPLAEGFTGEATAIGDDLSASGSDMQFSIDSPVLVEGAYHWQARVKKGDQASEWVPYGGEVAVASFAVDTTAPVAPTVETVASKAAASGATATVTTNRPTIAGKTDPNAVVTVTVSPENLSFNTTSDATGAWSLQPDRDIPNGSHQLSLTVADEAGNTSPAATLTLAVNPATAADTPAVTPAATPAATPPAVATTPATVSDTLAPTGDNTVTASLLSGLTLLVAIASLLWLRRRYAHA